MLEFYRKIFLSTNKVLNIENEIINIFINKFKVLLNKEDEFK